MFKLAWRGLLAHKGRLAATAAAVMLGVSFIAGTFVLTDTLKAAITSVISKTQSDVAVLVQARSHLMSSGIGQIGGTNLTVPDSTEAKVSAVPGVLAAEGFVVAQAQIERADGSSLSRTGAVSILWSVGGNAALSPFELTAGHLPTTNDEIVITAGAASNDDVAIGQQLKVAGTGAVRTYTVVGTVDYGSSPSLGGVTIVGMTLPAAQAAAGDVGRVSEVAASAGAGVKPTTLKARVAAALGSGFKVQTEAEAVQSTTNSLNKVFSIFSDVLLVFAGVALFVALFLIFNTFSILLAQRSRELALLRCIGAFRRQVALSVLGEALGVGVIASALGLGLGVLLALGLRALLSSAGGAIPSVAPVIAARTVVVSLGVGTVATMVAASLPAIRGSRTPPVAALRADLSVDTGRPTPLRLATGGLFVLAGVLIVALALGTKGNRINAANRAEAAGAGLVLLFLGMAALIPVVAKQLSSVIGWPFARLRRVPAEIGRRNAMRHPRRTGSTASALMIGLTLVTTIGVFARSAEVSSDAAIESGLSATFVVAPTTIAQVTDQVGQNLARLPDLRDVASLSTGKVKVDLPGQGSDRVSLAGTDVANWASDVSLPVTAGRLSAVTGRSIAVSTGVASTWHLGVGDTLPLTSQQASGVRFTVAAVFKDPTGLTGDLLVADAGFSALYPEKTASVSMILAKAAPGVSLAEATGQAYLATSPFPQVKLYTKATYIASINADFNKLVAIINALLGLAVIIALFGVVNTLALSIVERRREIGMMRALGMSQNQLRATIRWESVIVALLGTLLGVVLGLVFGWVVVDALRSDGINLFAVPVIELVLFVVGAGVAGVVAAVIPARTASRIDVLEAIASE